MEKKFDWVDVGEHGFQIAVFKHQEQFLLRVLRSDPNQNLLDYSSQLKQIGFTRSSGGNWFSSAYTDPVSGRVSPNLPRLRDQLFAHFPKTRSVKLTMPEIEGKVAHGVNNERLLELSARIEESLKRNRAPSPKIPDQVIKAVTSAPEGDLSIKAQELLSRLQNTQNHEDPKLVADALQDFSGDLTALQAEFGKQPEYAVALDFVNQMHALVQSNKDDQQVASAAPVVEPYTFGQLESIFNQASVQGKTFEDVLSDNPSIENITPATVKEVLDNFGVAYQVPIQGVLKEAFSVVENELKERNALQAREAPEDKDLNIKPAEEVSAQQAPGQQSLSPEIDDSNKQPLEPEQEEKDHIFEPHPDQQGLDVVVEPKPAPVSKFESLPDAIEEGNQPAPIYSIKEIDAAKKTLNGKLKANAKAHSFAYETVINDGGSKIEALEREAQAIISKIEDVSAAHVLMRLKEGDSSSLPQWSVSDRYEVLRLAEKYPRVADAVWSQYSKQLVELTGQSIQLKLMDSIKVPGIKSFADTNLKKKLVEAYDNNIPSMVQMGGNYDISSGGDLPVTLSFSRENGALTRLDQWAYKNDGWQPQSSFSFTLSGQPIGFDDQKKELWYGLLETIEDGDFKVLKDGFNAEYLQSNEPELKEKPTPPKATTQEQGSFKLVGYNQHGLQVHEDVIGRYYSSAEGKKIRADEVADNDERYQDFLVVRPDEQHRYDDMVALSKGMIMESAEKKMTKTDVMRYLSSGLNTDKEEIEGSLDYRRFHEITEMNLLHELRNSPDSGKPLYDAMIKLLENQASSSARTSSSVKNQQYSTPLPLSLAMTDILNANGPFKNILEPTIGNGSLVSRVFNNSDSDSPLEIVGYDLDVERLKNAEKLLEGTHGVEAHLFHADFTKMKTTRGQFERMVANPPFGKDPKFAFEDGLVTHRIDYRIAAQSLNALADDGIGAMVLGGDSFFAKNAGELKGGSRYFYNWLADNFSGAQVAEINGDVYKRMGATFPIRLAVVAGRGKSDPIPDKLPVLNNYDEVWSFVQEAKSVVTRENQLIKDRLLDSQQKLEHTKPVEVDESPKIEKMNDSEPELAKPRFKENQLGEKFIGHNQTGDCVYQDVKDARFLIKDGSRLYEGLSVIPTSSGVKLGVPTPKKRFKEDPLSDYLTVDEVALLKLDHTQKSEVETKVAPENRQDIENKEDFQQESLMLDLGEKTAASSSAEPSSPENSAEVDKDGVSKKSTTTEQDQMAEVEDRMTAKPDMSPNVKPLESVEHKVRDASDWIEKKSALQVVIKNDAQAVYSPMSQLGESTFLIPSNMASYVKEAQINFLTEFGDADAFVSHKLGYKEDELGKYFSPEQIDSIAFSISSHLKGRGFIVGDMTGIGKGRIVAAMLMYAVKETGKAIFMTEKPTLFKDIYRDLKDIGVDDPKIFLASRKSEIRNADESKVLYRAVPSEITKMEKTGEWPEGAEIICTTYSQVNRANSPRVDAFESLSEGAGLLLDEAHNASGVESNTNINVKRMEARSAFPIYSSATSSKRPDTMALYGRCFGPTIDMGKLEETLNNGGAALLEAVANTLVADGSFLVRQHDMSALEFTDHKNESSFDDNVKLTDAIAAMTRELGSFSGELNLMATKETKSLKIKAKSQEKVHGKDKVNASRAGVTSDNFGSRLFRLSRSSLLLSNLDETVKLAVKAIESGQKPVIALEDTMGSMLEEFIKEHEILNDFDTSALSDVSPAELSAITSGEKVLDRAPNFADYFHMVVDRMRKVNVRTGWGQCETVDVVKLIKPSDYDDTAQYEHAVESLERHIASIHDFIDEKMPDIPAYPIDYIKQKLADRGYSLGEVSGRNRALNISETGVVSVSEREPKKGRNKVIADFNNGQLDVIAITTAGMTGISLHSSDKFLDTRQRHLIVAQPPLDVNTYIQMLGRVNRNGQVVLPIISDVNNQMPSSFRLIAMKNAKLIAQSASTQASRESKFKTDSTPDLLNRVGDLVVKEYLLQNPEKLLTLEFMGAKIEVDKDLPPEVGLAKKLTGYISCFKYQDQVNMYNDLSIEFNNKIEELESQGINPLTSTLHDFKARVLSEELYSGVEKERYDSLFDAPVYLKEIEYDVEFDLISGDELMQGIETGKNRLIDDPVTLYRPDLTGVSQLLREKKPEMLEFAKAARYETVADALMDSEDNRCKQVNATIDNMTRVLDVLKPGSVFVLRDRMEDTDRRHVVLSVSVPDECHIQSPGRYFIKTVSPGKEVDQFSLNYLLNQPEFSVKKIADISQLPEFKADIDSHKSGVRSIKRLVLDGNPLQAAQIAQEKNAGEAAFYTTREGDRLMGVVMPLYMDKLTFMKGPSVLNTAQLAEMYMNDRDANRGGHLSTTLKEVENKTVSILPSVKSDELILKTPGTKKNGGYIFTDDHIVSLMKEEFAGNRKNMRAEFNKDNLGQVLEALYAKGVRFRAESENSREWINEAIKKVGHGASIAKDSAPELVKSNNQRNA